MGKRELLLVLGFVALGTLVYQVTAPPPAPGQSPFSLRRIVDNIRREFQGNRVSAEVTMTASHPVPEGLRELRLTLQNTPVIITGEDRTDIASELWVRSTGYDEAEAQNLDVRFSPEGDGTRVELVHTGWERRGAKAEQILRDYDSGWDYVFGERYAAAFGG